MLKRPPGSDDVSEAGTSHLLTWLYAWSIDNKQEIETWVQAIGHYDNNEFEEALQVFDNIADTSKILFNCGVIHATLGEHERAVCWRDIRALQERANHVQVECYQRAIRLDQYLAVAYFQQGVSNFLVGDFEEGLANFNDTLLYLRGNTYIDYEQLGLKFRLYSCEVLFNRGLCYIYLQQDAAGMQDFEYAVKEKMTQDHDVINDAIRERAEGYTVFSIPVGVIYRPNEAKVKNLKAKDYLGKARLVAASDRNNTGVGFQGSDRKQALAQELAAKDDRPPENISFAATNLVQKGLASRGGREQSAPPAMNRNVFPPTPPPESDKPVLRSSAPQMTGRAASVRNPPSKTPGQQQHNGEPPLNDPRPERPGPLNRHNTVDTIRSASPAQQAVSERIDMWSSPKTKGHRTRAASENRVPTLRRQYPERSDRPLFRETTSRRGFEPIQEDSSYSDVYDMYQPQKPTFTAATGTLLPMYSAEPRISNGSDEYMHDIYEEDEYDGSDKTRFEMLSQQPKRPNLPMRSSSRRRKEEIRNVRVKVRFHEDTRYMMFGSGIEYGDFESKIRDKFSIKNRMRIKMQDEGDMITMGDQDDLDMLLLAAKEAARSEQQEMAKMEVGTRPQPMLISITDLTPPGLDTRDLSRGTFCWTVLIHLARTIERHIGQAQLSERTSLL